MHKPVVVIGGGAAGMMAAGRAAQLGAQVLLIEKNNALGRKIYISGKGRCNVTNAGSVREFIENYPDNGHFLYSALNRFSNEDLVAFLESLGVPLKTERGGRIFPLSDRSADIIAAFSKYLEQGGVEIRLQETVLGIVEEQKEVKGVNTSRGYIPAQSLIVTTGGKSYPGTGSTGDGYRWAEELGHNIIPLRPALVPLNIKENWVTSLQGLSLKNVEVVLKVGAGTSPGNKGLPEDGKVLAREFGEMLFTHFGVSGPIILTLSRKVVDTGRRENLILSVNLKPALDEETLDQRVQRDFQKYLRKQIKNALDDLLPKRLIPVILELSHINPEKFVHQITRLERGELVKKIQALSMTVKGPRSLDEAIVTAGGVDLKEINPKTMESRLIKGLYFAGEVLDIDGYTGGYNLQAAFSTGFVCGQAAGLAVGGTKV